MTNTIDNTAIESLRTFAVAHGEMAFAHLCTAALAGEEWAIERVADTLRRIADASEYRDNPNPDAAKVTAIRATDTTRPDYAIARALPMGGDCPV